MGARSTKFVIAAGAIVSLIAAAPHPANAGLRNYAAAGYTPIGAVARGSEIQNNSDAGKYKSTLAAEYNLIGCENDLKMYIWSGWNGDPMTGSPIIDYSGADQVANF